MRKGKHSLLGQFKRTKSLQRKGFAPAKSKYASKESIRGKMSWARGERFLVGLAQRRRGRGDN